jgi:hypothetical protein
MEDEEIEKCDYCGADGTYLCTKCGRPLCYDCGCEECDGPFEPDEGDLVTEDGTHWFQYGTLTKTGTRFSESS